MPAPVRRRGRSAMLAAVLLALAACTGEGGGDAVEVPETGADLTVLGTDALRWEPERLEAGPGEIRVALACQQGSRHDLVIEGVGQVAECEPGEIVETTVELDAGTYEYVCSVPGHRRTMQGALVVE